MTFHFGAWDTDALRGQMTSLPPLYNIFKWKRGWGIRTARICGSVSYTTAFAAAGHHHSLLVLLHQKPKPFCLFSLHMPVPVLASIFIRLSFFYLSSDIFFLFLLHASPPFFFHLASAIVCQLSNVELCHSYLLPICSLHCNLVQHSHCLLLHGIVDGR